MRTSPAIEPMTIPAMAPPLGRSLGAGAGCGEGLAVADVLVMESDPDVMTVGSALKRDAVDSGV